MSIWESFKGLFTSVKEVAVLQLSSGENHHIVKQGKTTLVGLLEKNTAFIFSDKNIVYIKVEDIHTGKVFNRTVCIRYKAEEQRASVIVIDASSRVRPLTEDISFTVKAKGHELIKKTKV